MNLPPTGDTPDVTDVAIQGALSRIPPLWPLQHFVAVNPFLGLMDQPFAEACALLERTTGAAPLQSPAEYLAAWRSGVIQPDDLSTVTDEDWTAARLVTVLEAARVGENPMGLATVAELMDQEQPHTHWNALVIEEVCKWCAVTFDVNQATWRFPGASAGLYTGWREAARLDYAPEASGLRGFRAFVARLPGDPTEAIAVSLRYLEVPTGGQTDFLHRQLLSIAGWAGYVQYLVREETLRGRRNESLRELLAIRLSYDAALYLVAAGTPDFRREWRNQFDRVVDTTRLEARVRWQAAYEAGYQRRLAQALVAQTPWPRRTRSRFQAIFCIDVRSEVFRRHLEAVVPDIQTHGFAGFFGFPVAHRPAGAPAPASRCPVLLVPACETGEPVDPASSQASHDARAEAGAWKAVQNSAASCFCFVESVGLAFAAALGGASRQPTARPIRAAPALVGESAQTLATRTAMAEGALRNLGLTDSWARLVLICGHGSQSANNPYASTLDCGACGGHAGDVNARLAAAALNDPAVREGLSLRGLSLPADTVFVAGLHQTMTDEATLLDRHLVPASHAEELAELASGLAKAGDRVRQERASLLGLEELVGGGLLASLEARATDISQVRPEWGLANNAALVAAPRSRTASLNFLGRVFLHDYDATKDPDLRVLTLILSAPVVVASWINLQYYASRVDPVRYGSGNKALHNVVSGLGVVEGNGGDLKVGLPWQSLHDGTRFQHEPRRLSVFVEAPRESLAAVLAAQPLVRQLFDHGWIHLFALEGDQCQRYSAEGWTSWG